MLICFLNLILLNYQIDIKVDARYQYLNYYYMCIAITNTIHIPMETTEDIILIK